MVSVAAYIFEQKTITFQISKNSLKPNILSYKVAFILTPKIDRTKIYDRDS